MQTYETGELNNFQRVNFCQFLDEEIGTDYDVDESITVFDLTQKEVEKIRNFENTKLNEPYKKFCALFGMQNDHDYIKTKFYDNYEDAENVFMEIKTALAEIGQKPTWGLIESNLKSEQYERLSGPLEGKRPIDLAINMDEKTYSTSSCEERFSLRDVWEMTNEKDMRAALFVWRKLSGEHPQTLVDDFNKGQDYQIKNYIITEYNPSLGLKPGDKFESLPILSVGSTLQDRDLYAIFCSPEIGKEKPFYVVMMNKAELLLAEADFSSMKEIKDFIEEKYTEGVIWRDDRTLLYKGVDIEGNLSKQIAELIDNKAEDLNQQ